MVTDVRPLPGGTWLAMCECGLDELSPDPRAGWEWLRHHECLELEPYGEVLEISI